MSKKEILNQEDCMLSIEMDKRLKTVSVRVPDVTKIGVDKLDAKQKKDLNEDILVTIARHLHNAAFDPSKYLKES